MSPRGYGNLRIRRGESLPNSGGMLGCYSYVAERGALQRAGRWTYSGGTAGCRDAKREAACSDRVGSVAAVYASYVRSG